jgi:hypothetical protein
MMLPTILNQRDLKQNNIMINELLKTNEDSQKRGLILTPDEAKEIIISRDASLQNHGRVEVGLDTSQRLIQRLCQSPFISQEEYTSTLISIQEIFYYARNETEDKTGDEELMNIIFDFYDGVCEGSVELLREMVEKYSEELRRQNQKKDYLLMGVENQWR